MVELTKAPGVGIADLQRAALTEARRVVREAGGDRRVATELVLDRLRELGWISRHELDVLTTMHQVGVDSSQVPAGRLEDGRADATGAYLKVRRMYDEMLARDDAGAVALVLAAGIVGSYETVQGAEGRHLAYARSGRDYQGVLGGAGAIIGGAIGGAPGAAIGGAIGGVIGTIVDDCKD